MTTMKILGIESQNHEPQATDDTVMYVRRLLAHHEHLFALSQVFLDALAFAFVETRYRDGQALIKPASREPCVVLIVQGEVEIEDESGTHTRREGQLVSALACVDGSRAKQRCSARGPVRVAKLSGAAVRMLVGTNSEIGQALARACAPQNDTAPVLQSAA